MSYGRCVHSSPVDENLHDPGASPNGLSLQVPYAGRMFFTQAKANQKSITRLLRFSGPYRLCRWGFSA